LILIAVFREEFGAEYMRNIFRAFFSDISKAEAQEVVFYFRKSVHVLAYATVGIAGSLSVRSYDYLKKHHYFWGAVIGLFIASVDETLQYYMDFRTGSLKDVGIDFIGVLIGLSIIWVFDLWYRKKYLAENKRDRENH